MNSAELLELRSRTVELAKILPAGERRALLNQDVDDFIANGGKIEEIARGVSGAFPDVSMPIGQQKAYEKARVNATVQARIARARKPTELTESRFRGAVCPTCHTDIRFLSNAACVMCTKIRDSAKSKAMQGNSRRADGRKER